MIAQEVVVRFVCASIMHIMFWGKVKQGMDVMKYANNHEDVLKPWSLVYLIAFA